jgi:formate hydrogenlyase subunit 3/multisubunit Na+/H+ antiporter MnhD subunit
MIPIVPHLLAGHTLLTWAAIAVPLVLALAMLPRSIRSGALRLAPWAALPALALALLGAPGSTVEIPWLLLGMRLGTDATASVFLLFTAFLWTCAGVYARAYLAEEAAPQRFFVFYLLTLSGNLGAILAQDIASFYLFFALMSFAAYPLVVHDGTPEAHRAGKVYLALVVLGEVLLVSALMLTAASTGSIDLRQVPVGVAAAPWRDLIVALTLAGFGIKVGALPLHVWLPLAHPVAPTPASAVLSGTMIKVGLLGWLRFLPLGEVALPFWGTLCLLAGLLAAFYGVGIGLTQKDPKTVLAYSSISQMGFMTLAVGAGLVVPEAWALTLAAVLLYAMHHALAKGALFLGVGVAQGTGHDRWQRGFVLVGLLLPALALGGAPLTSGAAAKLALKDAVLTLPAPWREWLGGVLAAAAVGTTLLMGRFLWSVWPISKAESPHLGLGSWLPWAVLVVVVAVSPWLVALPTLAERQTAMIAALWPVGGGAFMALGAWWWSRKTRVRVGVQIPAGDLLALVERLLARVGLGWQIGGAAVIRRWLPWPLFGNRRAGIGRKIDASLRAGIVRIEERLGDWTAVSFLFLLLIVTLFILLIATS